MPLPISARCRRDNVESVLRGIQGSEGGCFCGRRKVCDEEVKAGIQAGWGLPCGEGLPCDESHLDGEADLRGDAPPYREPHPRCDVPPCGGLLGVLCSGVVVVGVDFSDKPWSLTLAEVLVPVPVPAGSGAEPWVALSPPSELGDSGKTLYRNRRCRADSSPCYSPSEGK